MWNASARLILGGVIATCVATFVLASSAHATSVVGFESPGVSSVQQGQVLDVAVRFDFDDLTLGGGFDLDFSVDLFSFKQFEFDLNLGDDPAFRSKPTNNQASGPYTIAFGSFAGLTGIKTVGILQLLAKQDLALGSGPVLVSASDNTLPSGPFVDELGAPLAVQYVGLRGSVVPEPGTALLLGVGLAALSVRKRGREESTLG